MSNLAPQTKLASNTIFANYLGALLNNVAVDTAILEEVSKPKPLETLLIQIDQYKFLIDSQDVVGICLRSQVKLIPGHKFKQSQLGRMVQHGKNYRVIDGRHGLAELNCQLSGCLGEDPHVIMLKNGYALLAKVIKREACMKEDFKWRKQQDKAWILATHIVSLATYIDVLVLLRSLVKTQIRC